MAKIIDFPKKRDIFFGLEDIVPKEAFDLLSIAYDKNKKISEKYPYILLKLSHSSKKEVESLIKEYEELTLLFHKRIMGLEKALFIEKEKR